MAKHSHSLLTFPPPHDRSGVGGWIGGFLVGSDQLVPFGVCPTNRTNCIDVVRRRANECDDLFCCERSVGKQQIRRSTLESIHPAFWGMLEHLLQTLVSQPLTDFELCGVHQNGTSVVLSSFPLITAPIFLGASWLSSSEAPPRKATYSSADEHTFWTHGGSSDGQLMSS